MLKALIALDSISLLWFNRLQCHSPLTKSFRIISHSGDGYLYLAITLIVLMQPSPHHLLFIQAVLLGFLFEIPSFICLKQILKRNRPFNVLSFCQPAVKPSDQFSMPSGHTAAAFLMACIIAFCFPSFSLIAYIWASLIGVSRVFLGVHYPTDIVVGALLGYGCATLSLSLLL